MTVFDSTVLVCPKGIIQIGPKGRLPHNDREREVHNAKDMNQPGYLNPTVNYAQLHSCTS